MSVVSTRGSPLELSAQLGAGHVRHSLLKFSQGKQTTSLGTVLGTWVSAAFGLPSSTASGPCGLGWLFPMSAFQPSGRRKGTREEQPPVTHTPSN